MNKKKWPFKSQLRESIVRVSKLQMGPKLIGKGPPELDVALAPQIRHGPSAHQLIDVTLLGHS
jgi:hypothetical protein